MTADALAKLTAALRGYSNAECRAAYAKYQPLLTAAENKVFQQRLKSEYEIAKLSLSSRSFGRMDAKVKRLERKLDRIEANCDRYDSLRRTKNGAITGNGRHRPAEALRHEDSLRRDHRHGGQAPT